MRAIPRHIINTIRIQPCSGAGKTQDVCLEPCFGIVVQLIGRPIEVADEELFHSFQIHAVQGDVIDSHDSYRVVYLPPVRTAVLLGRKRRRRKYSAVTTVQWKAMKAK